MIRWDIINETPDGGSEPKTVTDRMEVPGGHIIRTRVHGLGPERHKPASVAMVFIPSGGSDVYDLPPGGDVAQTALSS